jgi:hypothetical protein
MSRKSLFILIVFLFSAFLSKSQRISVSGNPTFSATDLNVTEAGDNFTSTITSTSGSLIKISNASTRYWHISVDRVDVSWNSNLHLWVRRSGNGTGYYAPYDGTTFQEVTSIDTYFFAGYGNLSSIPIQYQVSNISMLIPSGNYSTTIYYTVYRDW